MTVNDARIIKFPIFKDKRGSLTFIEELKNIPFNISRIYYLFDIRKGASRGSHAHKLNEGLLISIVGEFKVEIDDGFQKKLFHLNKPNEGLYIPKMIWRNLFDFSDNALCLALASHEYDENEYIRDYDSFLNMVIKDQNLK